MSAGAAALPPQGGEPLPPLQHPLDEAILGALGAVENGSLGLPAFLESAESLREQEDIASDDSISRRLMQLCGLGVLEIDGENFRSIRPGPEFTLAEASFALVAARPAVRKSTELVLIKRD